MNRWNFPRYAVDCLFFVEDATTNVPVHHWGILFSGREYLKKPIGDGHVFLGTFHLRKEKGLSHGSTGHFNGRRQLAVAGLIVTTDLLGSCMVLYHSSFRYHHFTSPLPCSGLLWSMPLPPNSYVMREMRKI